LPGSTDFTPHGLLNPDTTRLFHANARIAWFRAGVFAGFPD
jgi:hypothetical protein